LPGELADPGLVVGELDRFAPAERHQMELRRVLLGSPQERQLEPVGAEPRRAVTLLGPRELAAAVTTVGRPGAAGRVGGAPAGSGAGAEGARCLTNCLRARRRNCEDVDAAAVVRRIVGPLVCAGVRRAGFVVALVGTHARHRAERLYVGTRAVTFVA